MPFTKGRIGNPNGRPIGSADKSNKVLRDLIKNFLINNFDRIKSDFEVLSPKDRLKVYCDLLQYGLPKLQTVQMESDFDNLSDNDLDKIIENLKSSIDEKVG